jgi:hypothetical protein
VVHEFVYELLGIEPSSRPVFTLQKQQRLVSEVLDLEIGAAKPISHIARRTACAR